MIKRLKDILQGKAGLKDQRSKQWPWFRKEFLKSNPSCAICGGIKEIEVHHIIPFHERPDLELYVSNLITLCESGNHGLVCHLFFGHLGDYHSANPDVKEDAIIWHEKLRK